MLGFAEAALICQAAAELFHCRLGLGVIWKLGDHAPEQAPPCLTDRRVRRTGQVRRLNPEVLRTVVRAGTPQPPLERSLDLPIPDRGAKPVICGGSGHEHILSRTTGNG